MRRSGMTDRGRLLLLLTAFILQAFTAYHFGARSVTASVEISDDIDAQEHEPKFHYTPRAGAAPVVPMTCRSTTLDTALRPTFVMGSMTDRETSYDWIVISNKNRYAAKHHYDIVWDFEKNDKYSKDWDRLTAMEALIKAKLKGENDYEWIWWTDYDLIITNSSITLESVVEEALAAIPDKAHRSEIDMIVAPDCFPMNSGSLLVRTTQWSLDWIREMWRQGEIDVPGFGKRSLQDCLADMVKKDMHNIQRKSTFVKQYKINAFPFEIKCHQDDRSWERGDFVVHMAGAWAHVRADDPTGLLLRKYVQWAI